MYFVGNWRDRPRNFAPPHFQVTNYCTDINLKAEMKEYSDDIFQNLHLIPDPLKKNLADQFVNHELPTKMPVEKNHMNQESAQNESTLSGITNFISGVFNVLSSAMFKRTKTEDHSQMASDWQDASRECKNGTSDHILGNDIKNDMSNCRTAAINCEDKLNKVRLLLNSRTTSGPVNVRSRRPKRVFVEPNHIEEHFQDAFSPEEYISLANESYSEYYSPLQYQIPEYCEVQGSKMRTYCKEVNDKIDIGNHMPKVSVNKQPVPDNVNKKKCLLNQNNISLEENITKDELITSCEDKLMKLKAMLQENRKKNTNLHTIQNDSQKCTDMVKKPSKSIPINKTKDKRFKNPNRLCDKRKKCHVKQSIQDELLFAQEVALDQSSYEDSPTFHSLEKIYEDIPFSPSVATPVDCFNEVSGKFCNSNSSEDSFQIVFSDVPRLHRLSDCDSEDSFIIFDDSADSCFTSNDVFGDSDEGSDTDSDLSDSGFKISSKLSRTVSDLTDDSLYCEDVVDFAKPLNEEHKSGLLVSSKRKDLKKSLPPKKVRFSTDPPKVHVMRVWAFAARQARAGHWERYALDRERFKRRIADVDMAVSWVLKPQHRSRVMFQRFMPWWNAQKRKEIAEKKQREEEEKSKIAETAEKDETGSLKIEAHVKDVDCSEKLNRSNVETDNIDLSLKADLVYSAKHDDINKIGSKEVGTGEKYVNVPITSKCTTFKCIKSGETNLDDNKCSHDHKNCTEDKNKIISDAKAEVINMDTGPLSKSNVKPLRDNKIYKDLNSRDTEISKDKSEDKNIDTSPACKSNVKLSYNNKIDTYINSRDTDTANDKAEFQNINTSPVSKSSVNSLCNNIIDKNTNSRDTEIANDKAEVENIHTSYVSKSNVKLSFNNKIDINNRDTDTANDKAEFQNINTSPVSKSSVNSLCNNIIDKNTNRDTEIANDKAEVENIHTSYVSKSNVKLSFNNKIDINNRDTDIANDKAEFQNIHTSPVSKSSGNFLCNNVTDKNINSRDTEIANNEDVKTHNSNSLQLPDEEAVDMKYRNENLSNTRVDFKEFIYS